MLSHRRINYRDTYSICNCIWRISYTYETQLLMHTAEDEQAQTVQWVKKMWAHMGRSVNDILQPRGLQLACQHELSTFHLLQGHWCWGLWTMFLFDWKWLELMGKRQSPYRKRQTVCTEGDVANPYHTFGLYGEFTVGVNSLIHTKADG